MGMDEGLSMWSYKFDGEGGGSFRRIQEEWGIKKGNKDLRGDAEKRRGEGKV